MLKGAGEGLSAGQKMIKIAKFSTGRTGMNAPSSPIAASDAPRPSALLSPELPASPNPFRQAITDAWLKDEATHAAGLETALHYAAWALHRKEQLGAAAAAALSEMTRGNCSPSKECREPKMPTRVGKKLANVAVSCAHESLASYRQEMQVARKFK